MNIIDVTCDIPTNVDRLESIFMRQRELMEKYHVIEDKNGLLLCKDIPVGLHDKFGQARLKDMFWRFTEELGEAMDAFVDPVHFHEELVDALHFLVEALILSDITPIQLTGAPFRGQDCLDMAYRSGTVMDKKWVLNPEHVSKNFTFLITRISMAANCLKNKPWKQTQMITDEDEYRRRMSQTFNQYIRFVYVCGITEPKDLHSMYFRKSEVNKFRQNSNY